MKKYILAIILCLFVVGCSTPIWTLGPHQTTQSMSGKWTFNGSGDDTIEVDVDMANPDKIGGAFHLTGVESVTFVGTGMTIEQWLRTTRVKGLILGSHSKEKDVLNSAIVQHGGINELIHGEGDDVDMPTDVFKGE